MQLPKMAPGKQHFASTALADVAGALTGALLERVLRVVDADLRSRFAVDEPRIGVCGLNPHAGESGHLGREEIDTIVPVLKKLIAIGLDLKGPLPADTAFTPQFLSDLDVVVAMFHDQGLPVIKHAGFGDVVNITPVSYTHLTLPTILLV